MTRVMTLIASTTLFWLTALLCVAVALFSVRFLLPRPFMAEAMALHMAARPLVFLTHVASALTALALAPFQLITRTGARRLWHRWAGRVYVAASLTGAASGFGLAVASIGGPLAGLGFGLLAVAWFAATVLGWRKAVAGDFSQHRRWMFRSLSLTFAAVTLRIMLPLVPATGLDFLDAYRAIAFLCWVPNLIVMEIWLRLVGRDARPPAPRGRSPGGGRNGSSGSA